MVDIIFIIAVLLGVIGAVGTYWHAVRRGSGQPVRWCVIIGLTAFLSPLAID